MTLVKGLAATELDQSLDGLNPTQVFVNCGCEKLSKDRADSAKDDVRRCCLVFMELSLSGFRALAESHPSPPSWPASLLCSLSKQSHISLL